MYLYRTTLVPRLWQRLCESNDPGRYSIVQEIVQTAGGSQDVASQTVLLTVVYQLNEPTSAASSPSSSTTSPTDMHNPFPLIHCDTSFMHELPISPISATFSDNSAVSPVSEGYLPPSVLGHIDESTFANISPLPIDDTFDHNWHYSAPSGPDCLL